MSDAGSQQGARERLIERTVREQYAERLRKYANTLQDIDWPHGMAGVSTLDEIADTLDELRASADHSAQRVEKEPSASRPEVVALVDALRSADAKLTRASDALHKPEPAGVATNSTAYERFCEAQDESCAARSALLAAVARGEQERDGLEKALRKLMEAEAYEVGGGEFTSRINDAMADGNEALNALRSVRSQPPTPAPDDRREEG